MSQEALLKRLESLQHLENKKILKEIKLLNFSNFYDYEKEIKRELKEAFYVFCLI